MKKLELTAKPNYSKKTFTIRYNGSKYRTAKMQKIEFEECLFNTCNDWKNYLRNNQVTAINWNIFKKIRK